MDNPREFGLQALCVCGHREWSHWRGECRAHIGWRPCECEMFKQQAGEVRDG